MKAQNANTGEISDNTEDRTEVIPLGSIVSVLAHPYQQDVTDVLITTYANHTPPLMVVIEKKYGSNFNAESGDREDNDQYKCIFYVNKSGSFEEYWFKRREIKLIKPANSSLSDDYNNKLPDVSRKELIGRSVIMTTVDFELEKKKVWSDSIESSAKMKMNNLLDFLPPVGSIIAVKLTEDHQKFDEKKGAPIFKKSKFQVKIRWMNNHTSKFSEHDIPLIALKGIDDELQLFAYERNTIYLHYIEIQLEESTLRKIRRSPLIFERAIWKHYFYLYEFKNLFTGKKTILKKQELRTVASANDINPKNLAGILRSSNFSYLGIIPFFREKSNVENKWFEIRYFDKRNRVTQRIIHVTELVIDTVNSDQEQNLIIKANCLLRNGAIRHFNVERISAFRSLDDSFEEIFVSTGNE